MSAYLQRLYDVAGGTAVAVEARPAQRSSSPLLAVDQRLASPAYVGSFLLGLPGSADPEPDVAPPPEPDPLTFAEPGRRYPVAAADEGPAPVLPPHRRFATTPQPKPDDPVVPGPGPVAAPEHAVRRPATRRETDAVLAAHATPPAAEPTPPPVEVHARTVVEPMARVDPGPRPPRKPGTPHQVVEPAPPPQPGRLRAVPPSPTRPEPEQQRVEGVTTPPLLHPAPAKVAEPLPPPPAPVAAGEARAADLADRVRRLVREAMADDGTPRRTSRDQQDGPVTDPATPSSPARTAEAMSVIGPLDGPARSTTLYGLRLR
jgi:hypothetical protein